MFEAILKSNLITAARAFATAKGIELTSVSRKYHGDHRFIQWMIDDTKGLTVGKYDAIIARLSEDWPEGLDWPQAIPRPGDEFTVTITKKGASHG